MQLFIGGACAGKRDVVAARFPAASWHRLEIEQPLSSCQHAMVPNTPLVITGVLEWLSAALNACEDTDALRQQWQHDLSQLCQAAKTQNVTLIIIATEVGRGIVPIQHLERRLRDFNGWFTQDATAQAKQVWYVRHGLVMAIKSPS